MRRLLNEENILSLTALALVAISPVLFPAAQAGYAKLSFLAVRFLIPSIVLLMVVVVVASARGHRRLVNRIVAGAGAGLVATLALEAVRITSFKMGGMPGDLPRLLGVLLTDQFMVGPSTVSDILGFSYHFWNGASFGIIYALLLGKRNSAWGMSYGVLVGLGFLASPATKAMGVGFMASNMPAMQLTVVIAHLGFGLLLAILTRRWVRDEGWLFSHRSALLFPDFTHEQSDHKEQARHDSGDGQALLHG